MGAKFEDYTRADVSQLNVNGRWILELYRIGIVSIKFQFLSVQAEDCADPG